MPGWVDEAGVFRLTGHNRTSHESPSTVRKPCGRRSDDHPEWHIIAALPTKQFLAENVIAAAGWRVFHPLHLHRTTRNPDKIISLFPGYLFVRWKADTDWSSLCRIPYVWKILMTEPGRPAVVPDEVVGDLRRRTSSRRIVDDPFVTPPHYRPGTELVVTRGPLTGLEGVCKLSGPDRVTLLFTMLGSEFARDVAPLDILPVESRDTPQRGIFRGPRTKPV